MPRWLCGVLCEYAGISNALFNTPDDHAQVAAWGGSWYTLLVRQCAMGLLLGYWELGQCCNSVMLGQTVVTYGVSSAFFKRSKFIILHQKI